jgi:hypothetical protein
LEHRLDSDQRLPYVIKDPWLFAYFRDIDLSAVSIDALILPMRDLMAAAESRVYQERIALNERSPRDADAQVIGATPGGVLYSLDVVDQARILGVGFHNVLNWAVVNELRLFLLSFPRMVEDCDYLLQVLWPWLGEHCEIDVAREAFADVATADAVRIDRGLVTRSNAAILARGEPDRDGIVRAAMAERIRELDDATALLERRAADAERERDAAAATVAVQEQELQALRTRADRLAGELAAVSEQLAGIRATAVWRLRQRAIQHGLLYRLGRRVVRMLAR